MEKLKVNIHFKEWMHRCADGCCTDYGTTTLVNGEEVEYQNDDAQTIVSKVLEYLGYDVEITYSYDDE